jgi:integrating conjugative element protein (TIGR03765 family)
MAKFNEDCTLPQWRVLLSLTFVAFFFLFPGGKATAEVIVIYDTGTGRPLSDFVKTPQMVVPEGLPDNNLPASDDFVPKLFPVHTPELTPGAVTRQSTSLFLPHPFFILGCDARSTQWLSQYHPRLRQIGAVGLVVEAPSLADFQALSAVAKGLRLSPVNASQLAQQLSIRHYPVLVTASLIEQ